MLQYIASIVLVSACVLVSIVMFFLTWPSTNRRIKHALNRLCQEAAKTCPEIGIDVKVDAPTRRVSLWVMPGDRRYRIPADIEWERLNWHSLEKWRV